MENTLVKNLRAEVSDARIINGRLYANVAEGFVHGYTAGMSLVTLKVINVGMIDGRLVVVTENGNFQVNTWKEF
ncbi:MAG: hypothetical protein ACRCTW_11190 [Lactococcus garvieae]